MLGSPQFDTYTTVSGAVCAIAFPPIAWRGAAVKAAAPPMPISSSRRRVTCLPVIAVLERLPLQFSGRAGGRAFGAALRPVSRLRERAEIDPRRARPGQDAGDV